MLGCCFNSAHAKLDSSNVDLNSSYAELDSLDADLNSLDVGLNCSNKLKMVLLRGYKVLRD